MKSTNWLDDVTFNNDGLIPAIAQDMHSGDILMMAWMNREALLATSKTKTAVYFSRSRGKLWPKGETSGHIQTVHDIYLDCDSDVIILKVTQLGGIACHTGRHSCFYKRLTLEDIESQEVDPAAADIPNNIDSAPTWQTVLPVLKDPEQIYGSSHQSEHTAALLRNDSSPSSETDATDLNIESKTVPKIESENTPNTVSKTMVNPLSDTADNQSVPFASQPILNQLDKVLQARKEAEASSSYVASLYAKGLNKILEKVGEESVETIIAAKELQQHLADSPHAASGPLSSHTANAPVLTDNPQANDLIYEVADVWFHTLVALSWFNIDSTAVLAELARRFGLSGIEEKNSR